MVSQKHRYFTGQVQIFSLVECYLGLLCSTNVHEGLVVCATQYCFTQIIYVWVSLPTNKRDASSSSQHDVHSDPAVCLKLI